MSAAVAALRHRRPARTVAARPGALLVLICLAQFMVILDISIVNVALPSLPRAPRLSAR